MTIEQQSKTIIAKWKLSTLHLFIGDEYGCYRVFGFRKTARGFNASVAEGFGDTISDAIADLDDSLKIGPVKANEKKTARMQLPSQ